MEQLPKIVRERLKAGPGRNHPDPDLLTAFAEQALPEQERSSVLSHLSRCADCRDVLVLAVPAVTATESLDTARPTPWFQWRVLRWGAAAACVVIVGSAVMLRRDSFQMRSAKTAAVSEERQGEQHAYERTDQAPPPSFQEQQQESMSAAPSAATKTANEEDRARTREKALKLAVSPKLPAAVPVPTSPLRESRQMMAGAMGAGAAKGAAVGGMSGKTADADRITAGQLVVDETKKAAAESSTVSHLEVSGRAETVEVQAAAPAVDNESSADKREALGKAKPPSSAVLDSMVAAAHPAAVAQNQAARSQGTVSQKMDRAKLRHSLVSRWTISSDGQLQHSIDSGQTWQPVAVAETARFRALSANGPDIWVGGAAGLLYHSSDAGASWTQVKPTSGDAALSADISAIEFTDLLHGKITASSGEVWITEDGGQNWRKQP
jgi:hypothetical protein